MGSMRFPLRRSVLFIALTATCAMLSGGAGASVPGGAPLFADSLTITNPFFPVVPDSVKVYGGRDGGKRITVVENHLIETREFFWAGQTVPCRIVENLKFVSGRLIERKRGYYAQSIDGTVWRFGETEDEEDDEEEDPDEPNGWVVGQVLASDPPKIVSVESPAIYMAATPEAGDSWPVENHSPDFLTNFSVENPDVKVRVPAGRFPDCLRVRVDNLKDGDFENAWFAPGIGLVRTSARDERIRLRASSIRSD